MPGWIVPPPREPVKGRAKLQREREEKVRWLVRHGFLRSERIKAAMLKVRREDFIPLLYRDYAYQEVPLPLPGESATISCPHSYPLFYEALGGAPAAKYTAGAVIEEFAPAGLVSHPVTCGEPDQFARRDLKRGRGATGALSD